MTHFALFFKSSLASKIVVFVCAIFTSLAVSEAFQGQLIIALIAALPPTGAVIVALFALLRGQKAMQVSMDGKLSELIEAKGAVAHAAGAKEERMEARAQAREDVAPVLPAQIEIVNASDNPVPVKPVDEPKKLK